MSGAEQNEIRSKNDIRIFGRGNIRIMHEYFAATIENDVEMLTVVQFGSGVLKIWAVKRSGISPWIMSRDVT